MLVVAKFGGSSVQDAKCIKQVANIINSNINIRIVVLSAVSGITDKLIEIFKLPYTQRNKKCLDIVNIHKNIIEELDLNNYQVIKALELIISELYSISEIACNACHLDQLLSLGERLSSMMLFEFLKRNQANVCFLDARDIVITNNNFGNALPKIKDIKLRCINEIVPKLEDYIIITQGFIGSTKKGVTTTLGRGGSDYSSALIAEALNADRLEIYTDVKGVYTGDPSLISNSKLIANLSYEEMFELSRFGAKVLHHATITPCKRKNISILVKSTFDHESNATIVSNKINGTHNLIKAVTLLQNQLLIDLKKQSSATIDKIIKTLKSYYLREALIIEGKENISILINQSKYIANPFNQKNFLEEIQLVAPTYIEKSVSLITLVGVSSIVIEVQLRILKDFLSFPIKVLDNNRKVPSVILIIKNHYSQILLKQAHRIFFENDIIEYNDIENKVAY